MTLAPYGWMTLAGVTLSLVLWRRMARRDPRLFTIYLAAIAGAFFGAKLIYFFAEGWMHVGKPDMWRQLATGKSILGGLLGGYAAVEAAKRILGYSKATGDWFALIVPLGVGLGRVGCLTSGCCQGIEWSAAWFTLKDRLGVPRWPAVPLELLFNVVAFLVLYWLRKSNRLRGQLFHIYLIAYGVFRFLHEFVRDEPRIVGPLSGYHIAAACVLILGIVRFRSRSAAAAPTCRSDVSAERRLLLTDSQ